MVVIQNIINDINIDEDKLGLVCQKFMSETGIKESELLIRIVSPIESGIL